MLKRMADWPSKLKLVGDVRGRGLMIGVEIVKDKVTKEYGNAERDRIVEMAFERGVLFLGCGPSTIRICARRWWSRRKRPTLRWMCSKSASRSGEGLGKLANPRMRDPPRNCCGGGSSTIR